MNVEKYLSDLIAKNKDDIEYLKNVMRRNSFKEYDYEFLDFANYIIEHVPFDPIGGFGSWAYSSQDAANFLHIVHHAMVDDGDITFYSPLSEKCEPLFILQEHDEERFQRILDDRYAHKKEITRRMNEFLTENGKAPSTGNVPGAKASFYEAHHSAARYISDHKKYLKLTREMHERVDKLRINK